MPTIPATDERLHWAGAIHLQQDAQGVTARRYDPAEERLFFPGLVEKLRCPAGVRVRLRTTATSVAGRFGRSLEGKPVACVVAGEVVALAPIAGDRFHAEGLPAGDKTLELWLPHTTADVPLHSLEFDAEIAAPEPAHGPRWVHYGSSISHCGAAEHPAGTWPGVAARLGGLDLTCFGVGGQCHLDHLMARQIRDCAADAISLKVGINIQGGSSLSERTYGAGIRGFVTLLRERHPHTPIVVISPIYGASRETQPNAVGFTLEKMRVEAEAAVADLRACGADNVRYLDGLELFSAADAQAGLLPDDLHPNHDGYQLMGERFHGLVTERWFQSLAVSQPQ